MVTVGTLSLLICISWLADRFSARANGVRLAGGWYMCVVYVALYIFGLLDLPITLSLVLLWVVGTVDDYLDLRAHYKLVLTIVAVIPSVWISPLLALVLIIASHSANLLDGRNGLAAGYVFISMLALTSLFLWQGNFDMTSLSFWLALSLLPYLILNISGRWYLGDSGSLALGAVLGYLVYEYGGQTIWAVVYLAAVNVCYMVYKRYRAGNKPWHRTPVGLHEQGREVAPLLLGQTLICVAIVASITLGVKSWTYFTLGAVIAIASWWLLRDKYWLDQADE